jgi:hypothetical protein
LSNEQDQQPTDTEPSNLLPSEEEYPVDRLKTRVNQSLAGRPLTVYLVLFAGAATLLLLLAVVWISATGGGDDPNQQICTEIAPADARAAVLAGDVERINILVDNDDPTQTLTGIQLRFADDTCRQTPQGADIREQLLAVIGAVSLYNNYADTSIRVHYQTQQIESELLATTTPTPENTSTPTDTPMPTETAVPASPEPPPATHTATSVPPTSTTAASPTPTRTATP